VAIPASTVADTPHLREKTAKVGVIGRALAIFRVDHLLIYRDRKPDQTRDLKFIELILSYMATPQYLRRRLFPITPDLRYAGILPPLRTANHPLEASSKKLKIGEIRDGAIIKSSGNRSLVDIGVEKPALLFISHPVSGRISVRVKSINRDLTVETVRRKDIPLYWGFQVEATTRTLDEVAGSNRFDLKIATSRFGNSLSEEAGKLTRSWSEAKGILVAFGSPNEGVREILLRRGCNTEDFFDFVVNTMRDQGTETVRVEEAVISSLSAFNLLAEN
jgi:predicted SPOUT superfamily RNA methylase MTH1